MKSFPMFIRTTGRRVVIVGGGEQAAQKARLMLKTDAQLVLVAQTLEDELSILVKEGRATQNTTVSAAVFDDAAMAFIGTGCPGHDAAAHALAKAARCPVNVVDQPDLCDMTTPAIVDRDPLVVAIGSEGTASVLTRDIKTRLEQALPHNVGGLAALAGRLRPSVVKHVPRALGVGLQGRPSRHLDTRTGTRRRPRHQGRDRCRRRTAIHNGYRSDQPCRRGTRCARSADTARG